MTYYLIATAEGWKFSFNEDHSDASEPFPSYEAAEAAAMKAVEESLANVIATELFGA